MSNNSLKHKILIKQYLRSIVDISGFDVMRLMFCIVFSQFRFSDKLDVLLIVLASLSAICHGAALPLQFIIFGDLINSFIDFTKVQTANVTQTQPFVHEGQMTKLSLYYVYFACGTLFIAYGQMGLWSLTATRQVKKMRLAFFRSVLKQDIGWFDTTDPGELNTRLTE